MLLISKMVSIRAQLRPNKNYSKSLFKMFVVRISSDETQEPKKSVKVPEPPDNCCQSGCDNCVWIRYAEELAQVYRDGGVEAQKQIDQLINDPSLKVFIKQQIKFDKKSDDK